MPLSDHFGLGYDQSRGPQSMSLAEDSARWNEAAQAGLGRPNSILEQLQPSPNGLSQRDASRELPSGELLPTENGQGDSAYESGKQMLMRGVQNQYNTPVGSQP